MDTELYDKAWFSGHKAGYADALGEIYDLINRDDLRGDRLAQMADLTKDLRSRYEKVIEFYQHPVTDRPLAEPAGR